MVLGFPGQYFDNETGNYYNYFRDYDPTTGRYLQSDPIGLAGGINTYLYANANPGIYTDPTGENALAGTVGGFAVGGPVGALIGFGLGSWATYEFWNWYNDEVFPDDDAANDPIYDVDKEKVAICLLECDVEALDGAEDCLTNECLDERQFQECLDFVQKRRENCYMRCTAGR
jgi:RHS repeat-associated protein